jgi:molybdopterin synthase catalytic subunit
MNREDIEHMWKVASNNPNHDTNWHDPVVVAFAALVASAEREACIKACEQVTADLKNYAPAFEGITAEIKFVRNIGAILGEPFIDAIRARGQE